MNNNIAWKDLAPISALKTLTSYTGALYVQNPKDPDKFQQLTIDQGPWHDRLRAAFGASNSPGEAVGALQKVAEETIWDGGMSFVKIYFRGEGSDRVRIEALGKQHNERYKQLMAFFEEKKRKFK